MTERGELISLLESLSEEKFRVFNEKIVHTSKYRVIGVRMPDLKAIAKEHKADYKEIFELPYDSFEEIIIKGAAVGFADAPLCEKEPYIIRYAEMIDNWAECDCFCSCIKVKKSEEDEEELAVVSDKLDIHNDFLFVMVFVSPQSNTGFH